MRISPKCVCPWIIQGWELGNQQKTSRVNLWYSNTWNGLLHVALSWAGRGAEQEVFCRWVSVVAAVRDGSRTSVVCPSVSLGTCLFLWLFRDLSWDNASAQSSSCSWSRCSGRAQTWNLLSDSCLYIHRSLSGSDVLNSCLGSYAGLKLGGLSLWEMFGM